MGCCASTAPVPRRSKTKRTVQVYYRSAPTSRARGYQGVYEYSFEDLPEGIIAAIEQRFKNALVDVGQRADALLSEVVNRA